MKCKTAKRRIMRNMYKIGKDSADINSMSPSLRRYIGRCASVLNVCKKRRLEGADAVGQNLKIVYRY